MSRRSFSFSSTTTSTSTSTRADAAHAERQVARRAERAASARFRAAKADAAAADELDAIDEAERRAAAARRFDRMVGKLAALRSHYLGADTRYETLAQEVREQLRAKRLARRLGLAYWPAMLPINRGACDPRAFLAAERVMSRIVGGRYGDAIDTTDTTTTDTRCRGGWDAMGHYGLSPQYVAAIWKVAGCKDSPKFRYLIWDTLTAALAGRVQIFRYAKKGDHLPWLRNFRKGLRFIAGLRVNSEACLGIQLARDTIADLGRLCPASRWAAIRPYLPVRAGGEARRVPAPPAGCRTREEWHLGEQVPCLDGAVLRSRDLDWGGVRASQRTLAAAPAERAAILRAARLPCFRGLVELFKHFHQMSEEAAAAAVRDLGGPEAQERVLALTLLGMEEDNQEMLPELGLVREFVWGVSPRELVARLGHTLTRAEAAAWWKDGAPSDIDAWRRNGVVVTLNNHPVIVANQLLLAPRTHKVAVWLLAVAERGQFPAMLTEREAVAPGGGAVRRFRFVDILDEVMDGDIITGREGPSVVFQRAAERLGEAAMAANRTRHEELRPIPAWVAGRLRLPTGVRALTTPAQLVREGDEMRHCVGGYEEAVRSGRSLILAITTRQGRSTAEIVDPADPESMRLNQHFTVRNQQPPAQNRVLVEAWMNRARREWRRRR